MIETRESPDHVAVYGHIEAPTPAEGAAASTTSPGPSTAPAAPASADPSARIAALYEQLSPKGRQQLLPERVKELETEYLGLLEEQRVQQAARPAPAAAPMLERTAEDWTKIYGPPRGTGKDAEWMPEDTTWDVPALNQIHAALTEVGFPAERVLGDFVEAERQLARTWTAEEGQRALAATHGAAKAARMISDAQVALELLFEHPVGREHVARWEARDGLSNPSLVEALFNLLEQQPRDNDRWVELNLKRAAKWMAQRRGEAA